ncbi:hypothetical protein EIP86_011139 [Pleurotus ostreatoroseus]|nr:hypothetical protein EIP86_011139 [Pleurotus ostreatoroseus]
MEYHAFGIISEGVHAKYHYLICGVQGDFTRSLVNDPPTHLWTRQLKFAGVSNTSTLYKRGIRVCTGTGLGAALSTCIQNPDWFLIWIGSDQEKTFGPTIANLIHKHLMPDRCCLWDSKARGGRPDVMKLVREAYHAWGAEVVFITSNYQGNKEIMEGCKAEGIPAFSVEILPGDGSAWLNEAVVSQTGFIETEGHIGIPQKLLYKAYLEAIQSFNLRRHVPDQTKPTESIASHAADLIRSTAVLLLANPAHHTAWNTRKRLIQLDLLGAGSELGFCAALLTVRDCAKQSVLWHHRRWLLRRMLRYSTSNVETRLSNFLPTSFQDDEDSLRNLDVPLVTLRREFELCTLACNTYERNYFAWAHRYRCLDVLLSMLVSESSIHSEMAIKLSQMFRDEISWCREWVERHASDYSAVQYRCRLTTAAVHFAGVATQSPNAVFTGPFENANELWRHAKDLADAYPDHEALWMYVRGALQVLWESSETDGGIRNGEVKNWAKGHALDLQTPPESQENNSTALEYWNASRFMAWLDRQRTVGEWNECSE